MNKKRILWIDYSKAFLIFCVVLLHIHIQDPYNQFIRTFVIPFFFFISGIFFDPSKYENYTVFIKKRGIRILIPYLAFNVLTYLFWLLIGRHFGLDSNSNMSPLEPIYGILYGTSSLMYHYVPLWFLACLFSAESIYYFIFRKNQTRIYSLFAIVGFALIGFINYKFNKTHLPWSIDIALVMLVFFASGSLLRNTLINTDRKSWFYLVTILLTAVILYFNLQLNTTVRVYINEYGNFLYFLIGAFAGIFMIMSIFKLLTDRIKRSKVLEFVGKNTLLILALHLISGSVIKAISVYILKQPLSIYEIGWVKLIYAALSIAILYPIILFFNKYLPFLVGKSKIKS
jgi:fucose 4-O-acetylase-like acetyltransferase